MFSYCNNKFNILYYFLVRVLILIAFCTQCVSLQMNTNYDDNYKATAVFMNKIAVFIATNKMPVKENCKFNVRLWQYTRIS